MYNSHVEEVIQQFDCLDPRTARTRLTLQRALAHLLESKEFEKISIQNVADTAQVNRVTFYDHYVDKYALLNAMVAERFNGLLAARNISYDGGCASALVALVQTVCDFLANAKDKRSRNAAGARPQLESAVIAVLREMILVGLKGHRAKIPVSIEMLASSVSWAIYGAASEWAGTSPRCSSKKIADSIAKLVSPMLSVLA
jgi:AcrR family transcriptional regulator